MSDVMVMLEEALRKLPEPAIGNAIDLAMLEITRLRASVEAMTLEVSRLERIAANA